MNPLYIFKTLRDLNALIQQANALAGPDKRWSLAFTNRSFVLAVVGFLATTALMIGLPFPLPIDVTAETVYAILSLGALAWAGIERVTGKTRAIWTPRQAKDAVQEADALSEALRKAGAK
ncbi:hypothetical protein [Paracoccus homiensis]|nr:hypothetical protein [Paracoccus homiensis]